MDFSLGQTGINLGISFAALLAGGWGIAKWIFRQIEKREGEKDKVIADKFLALEKSIAAKADLQVCMERHTSLNNLLQELKADMRELKEAVTSMGRDLAVLISQKEKGA
mgnify:CR=1 FL=1